jgi:hypothetical protein
MAQTCCLAHGCLGLLESRVHVGRPEQLGPLAPTQRVGEGEKNAGCPGYEAKKIKEGGGATQKREI